MIQPPNRIPEQNQSLTGETGDSRTEPWTDTQEINMINWLTQQSCFQGNNSDERGGVCKLLTCPSSSVAVGNENRGVRPGTVGRKKGAVGGALGGAAGLFLLCKQQENVTDTPTWKLRQSAGTQLTLISSRCSRFLHLDSGSRDRVTSSAPSCSADWYASSASSDSVTSCSSVSTVTPGSVSVAGW